MTRVLSLIERYVVVIVTCVIIIAGMNSHAQVTGNFPKNNNPEPPDTPGYCGVMDGPFMVSVNEIPDSIIMLHYIENDAEAKKIIDNAKNKTWTHVRSIDTNTVPVMLMAYGDPLVFSSPKEAKKYSEYTWCDRLYIKKIE